VLDEDLIAVLTASQDLGFLGARPIPEVIDHARAFVRALAGLTVERDERPTIVDLGSGGGIPGLVIAADRPDVRLTLLDRRSKRTDFLDRMVHRLGWADRVDVVCDDAERVADRLPGRFTGAVARGFGPPELTLRLGAALVAVGGRIVISEPPDGDRWDPELLRRLGVDRIEVPVPDAGEARVAVFRRRA